MLEFAKGLLFMVASIGAIGALSVWLMPQHGPFKGDGPLFMAGMLSIFPVFAIVVIIAIIKSVRP